MSLFINDMLVYVENLKGVTKNTKRKTNKQVQIERFPDMRLIYKGQFLPCISAITN